MQWAPKPNPAPWPLRVLSLTPHWMASPTGLAACWLGQVSLLPRGDGSTLPPPFREEASSRLQHPEHKPVRTPCCTRALGSANHPRTLQPKPAEAPNRWVLPTDLRPAPPGGHISSLQSLERALKAKFTTLGPPQRGGCWPFHQIQQPFLRGQWARARGRARSQTDLPPWGRSAPENLSAQQRNQLLALRLGHQKAPSVPSCRHACRTQMG